MRSAAAYIDALQTDGRLVFTTEQAAAALERPLVAARAQLRRLRHKGEIAEPFRSFHVVVPPRYRRLGCLPADQFIADLMAHVGGPWYVALLSAAAIYGAAHQAPMALQVVVTKPRRDVVCGGVRIAFVTRSDAAATPVIERSVPTGAIRVASPEATALELVGYPEHCGYLDNVATVLAELAPALNGEGLAAEARRAPVAWVQRLGYLLTLVGANALAANLDAVLAERSVFPVALAPWLGTAGAPRDARWQVVVNTTVEAET